MRTFVAIELTEPCRRKLGEAVERLRGEARGVRWVDAKCAHLTLKFIGDLRERDLPDAIAALSSLASAWEPFLFRVKGLSGFPPKGRPRVIHAPVHEPGGVLSSLAVAVDLALFEAVGVAREKRPYKGHVTLGRVKDPKVCLPIDEIAAMLPEADFGEVPVEEIVLMKSDLTPRGPIYSPLERLPLGS